MTVNPVANKMHKRFKARIQQGMSCCCVAFEMHLFDMQDKPTKHQAVAIFQIHASLRSATKVARIYGVREKGICDIWKRRTWAVKTWHLDPMQSSEPGPSQSSSSGMWGDLLAAVTRSLRGECSQLARPPSQKQMRHQKLAAASMSKPPAASETALRVLEPIWWNA